MIFVIHANVPVPKPRPKYSCYPFVEMEIGDSFHVPRDPDGSLPDRVFLRVYQPNRRTNGPFTARKVDDGVRVWRLA